MKSNESAVPVAPSQFRIVNAILQFPCTLPCTLNTCTLAHYRSLGLNLINDMHVRNPNTALIIFEVINKIKNYLRGLVLFYYLDITTTSFTKGKWLLMLENANAFSRNLNSHKRRRTKLNSESVIQFMQRLDSRTLILSLLVMFQVL